MRDYFLPFLADCAPFCAAWVSDTLGSTTLFRRSATIMLRDSEPHRSRVLLRNTPPSVTVFENLKKVAGPDMVEKTKDREGFEVLLRKINKGNTHNYAATG
jgi:hypothetical protein